MSLSCEHDGIMPTWVWMESAYIKMPFKLRRKRCCSCKEFVNEGDVVAEHIRCALPDEGSVDYRIYGWMKRLSNWYECSVCDELRQALEELGYCVNLGDNMRDNVSEYNKMRETKNNKSNGKNT